MENSYLKILSFAIGYVIENKDVKKRCDVIFWPLFEDVDMYHTRYSHAFTDCLFHMAYWTIAHF